MARLCSVTSLATASAPMTTPDAFLIGDRVSDTSMSRPVFGHTDRVVALDPFAPGDSFEKIGQLLSAVGTHQHAHRTTDGLLGGIAVHASGATVPAQDRASQVLGENRIVGRFDQRVEDANGFVLGAKSGGIVHGRGILPLRWHYLCSTLGHASRCPVSSRCRHHRGSPSRAAGRLGGACARRHARRHSGAPACSSGS